jgi:hypothetical protein
MSVRSTSRPFAVVALVAALVLGGALVSPARALTPAVAPPAVSGLTIGTQSQGLGASWVIPVSWQASTAATGYTVSISNTAGTVTYETRDVSGLSVTLTTDALLDGRDYRILVVPFTGDEEGPATAAPFTAITIDHSAPTGSFTVSPTHTWVGPDGVVGVTVTQTALADNTTAADRIERTILAGDGSEAQAWDSGTSYEFAYFSAGVFTPKVTLTDEFGIAATISLSPVTVNLDTLAPIIRVVPPPRPRSDRIAGWRVVHGTVSDVGSGVRRIFVTLLQRRGDTWYYYRFGKGIWVKGRGSEAMTFTAARAGAVRPGSDGRWQTRWIHGLRLGRISVYTFGTDRVGNYARGAIVRHRITRR